MRKTFFSKRCCSYFLAFPMIGSKEGQTRLLRMRAYKSRDGPSTESLWIVNIKEAKVFIFIIIWCCIFPLSTRCEQWAFNRYYVSLTSSLSCGSLGLLVVVCPCQQYNFSIFSLTCSVSLVSPWYNLFFIVLCVIWSRSAFCVVFIILDPIMDG